MSYVFAKPMLATKEYLEEYKKPLIELYKKGLLPKLDLKLKYNVYSIRGSEFGAHESIVLTSDDEHFVSVELGFITVDGKKHVYPVTREVEKSLKANMEFLDVIEATGQELLIDKAVAVMTHFGSYCKFCHNCQDFCNMYKAAIGLKGAQKLTDGDKVSIPVLLVSIILILFVLVLVSVLSYNRKQKYSMFRTPFTLCP
ncbi:uncharacterized protein [Montipora foliosa]|uniref:uncharacterized protein n=1 Tax=Montipora foliosa TaxID=591990 RepID=UPI0035F1E212